MTPQELKNSILQLAIQGKLVEQRLEEGTGEKLYQRIQAEKQKLIKNGTIKKEKPLLEVTEDEKPFEIPESWVWAKVGALFAIERGSSPRPIQAYLTTSEDGVNWIKIGDSDAGAKYITSTSEKISQEGAKKSRLVNVGDFIISNSMSFGRPYIMAINGYVHDGWNIIHIIKLKNEADFNKDYLYYVLSSNLLVEQMKDKAAGGVVKNIRSDSLRELIIPLPPHAEQKRIVAKIEELLPYIDRYEKAWSKLEDFNKRFPTDMQKSILQTAIQGKLIEQCPEEGTGEELYQQIQAEKQRLIKAGTIKKEKPLQEITEDEKPFDIPESWKWVRLSSICKSIADGDHQAPPQVPSGVPFLVISNLSSGVIDFSNTRHVPQEYFDNLSSERVAENGDLIFTVTGSYGIPVKVDCDVRFCFQRHMALLKTLIYNEYLFYLLKSPVVKEQCDKVATGTAQKTVGLDSLRNIIVPLPPLDEQKRIVDKLEEILPLCENLFDNKNPKKFINIS